MTKKASKKKEANGGTSAQDHPTQQYVSTAWISTLTGIHASTVEAAWRRGDIPVATWYADGRNRSRPLFDPAAVRAWAKGLRVSSRKGASA